MSKNKLKFFSLILQIVVAAACSLSAFVIWAAEDKPRAGGLIERLQQAEGSLSFRIEACILDDEDPMDQLRSRLIQHLPGRAQVIRNSNIVENTKGASTRQLYSLTPKEGVQGPNWFIMIDPRSNVASEVKFDAATDEFLLVRQAFEEAGVNVPTLVKGGVYHGVGRDGRGGIVIIEHLGKVTFQQRILETKNSDGGFDKGKEEFRIHLYKKALDELVKIQFNPDIKKLSEDHPLQRSFDEQGLYKRAQLFDTYFLNKLLPIRFSEQLPSLNLEVVDYVWSLMSSKLGALFEVNVHRDYHSDNLMSPAADSSVASQKDVVVIDFQDAARGNFLIDVVSLIEDPYVNLPQSEKEQLKLYYIELLKQQVKKGLAPLNVFVNFDEMYALQTIQRMAAAIGVFSRLSVRDHNHNFLKHIGPALKIMRTHVESLPEDKKFFMSLAKGPLLGLFEKYELTTRDYLR